jgi:hypothetical protein
MARVANRPCCCDIRGALANARGHSAGCLYSAYDSTVSLVTFAVSLLSISALILAIASAYRGEPLSFADAYRDARERWRSQVLVAVGLGFMVGFFLFAAGLAGYSTRHILWGAIGYVIGLVVLVMGYLVWQFAAIAICVEGVGAPDAAWRGYKRATDPAFIGASLLVVTVLFVLQLGAFYVLGVAQKAIGTITHFHFVGALFGSVTSAFVIAFVMCYFVVYSYDLRERREGFVLA